jgi:hypothetical protein
LEKYAENFKKVKEFGIYNFKERLSDPEKASSFYVMDVDGGDHPFGGIVPLSDYEKDRRAWWSSISECIVSDQKPTLEVAKELRDLLSQENCTLQDIRWHSLLHGCRTPSNSSGETKNRIQEAKVLLEHIFNCDYLESLKILTAQPETAKFLLQNSGLLKEANVPHPTKEALLAFKDRLRIPDADWNYVCDTFNLGAETTLHYIRLLRQDQDKNLQATPTPTRNGSQLNVVNLLQKLLKKNPPKDPIGQSSLLLMVVL